MIAQESSLILQKCHLFYPAGYLGVPMFQTSIVITSQRDHFILSSLDFTLASWSGSLIYQLSHLWMLLECQSLPPSCSNLVHSFLPPIFRAWEFFYLGIPQSHLIMSPLAYHHITFTCHLFQAQFHSMSALRAHSKSPLVCILYCLGLSPLKIISPVYLLSTSSTVRTQTLEGWL